MLHHGVKFLHKNFHQILLCMRHWHSYLLFRMYDHQLHCTEKDTEDEWLGNTSPTKSHPRLILKPSLFEPARHMASYCSQCCWFIQWTGSVSQQRESDICFLFLTGIQGGDKNESFAERKAEFSDCFLLSC